jgi:hypothetical protein
MGGMGARIPQIRKSQVIQKWLSGIPRDRIAAECGMSGGAVSGIIDDWRAMVGAHLADQLRELAIALRKRSLTPAECATALRFVNIMSNLGVNEEALEYFISEIYARSAAIGLGLEQISRYIAELVDFWSARGVSVGEEEEEQQGIGEGDGRGGGRRGLGSVAIRYFSEIPGYIAGLKEEKVQLESQIQQIRSEVRGLNNKKFEAELQLQEMLRNNAITAQHLDWYSEVKAELQRCGLEVAEVKRFVSAVRWMKENQVNLVQVIKQFPSYQNLFHGIVLMKNKIADLERIQTESENAIQTNRLKISEIENLKSLGFGLKELRLLHQTLKEINEAHGLTSTDDSATKRFLADVENEYDSLLGFKAKLYGLKNQCKRFNEERNREIAKLETIPFIGSTISALFRKGLTEVDLLQIASLFHNYPDFLDVWSSFKAKREKESDSKVKQESRVVNQNNQNNQNLQGEVVGERNKMDDSFRDSQAPRNRDESGVEAVPVTPQLENERDYPDGDLFAYLQSLYRKNGISWTDPDALQRIAPSNQTESSQENYCQSELSDPKSQDKVESTPESLRQPELKIESDLAQRKEVFYFNEIEPPPLNLVDVGEHNRDELSGNRVRLSPIGHKQQKARNDEVQLHHSLLQREAEETNHGNYRVAPNSKIVSSRSRTGPKPPSLPKPSQLRRSRPKTIN